MYHYHQLVEIDNCGELQAAVDSFKDWQLLVHAQSEWCIILPFGWQPDPLRRRHRKMSQYRWVANIDKHIPWEVLLDVKLQRVERSDALSWFAVLRTKAGWDNVCEDCLSTKEVFNLLCRCLMMASHTKYLGKKLVKHTSILETPEQTNEAPLTFPEEEGQSQETGHQQEEQPSPKRETRERHVTCWYNQEHGLV